MHSNRCKKPVVSANGDSLRVQATVKSVHYKFEMSVKVQSRVIIIFIGQTHALI